MDKRLKIEEIFSHPWVLSFEKEEKEKVNEDIKRRSLPNKLKNDVWNTASEGFFKKKDNKLSCSPEKELRKLEKVYSCSKEPNDSLISEFYNKEKNKDGVSMESKQRKNSFTHSKLSKNNL